MRAFPGHGRRAASLALLALAVAVSGCSKGGKSEPERAAADSGGTFHGARGEPNVTALARRVIEAHGGIRPWMGVGTVSYTEKLVFSGQDKPWVSRETIEETPVRRLYQDWISHGGSLAWDGKEVWTVHWGLPNPPRLMPFLTYYALITPWLVFDHGVTVESAGEATIPGGDGTRYPSFMLRIPADTTRPAVAGYYRILVDPATGRMKAVAFTITYGPLMDRMGLPPRVAEIGPMMHVYDEYKTVGGLLLPTRYHTVGPDGSPAGDHTVTAWKLGAPFDESRMKKPANAVVDKDSYSRRNPSS
jgi:hypothetical protein